MCFPFSAPKNNLKQKYIVKSYMQLVDSLASTIAELINAQIYWNRLVLMEKICRTILVIGTTILSYSLSPVYYVFSIVRPYANPNNED
jgi:hypothetical protein